MPQITGTITDPAFRTERARNAAAASNGVQGTITRFLRALPELSDEQIETIRRALPPAEDRVATGVSESAPAGRHSPQQPPGVPEVGERRTGAEK